MTFWDFIASDSGWWRTAFLIAWTIALWGFFK